MLKDEINGILENRQEDPGDFRDESGILLCGKCRTPKEQEIEWIDGEKRKMPVPCSCESKAEEERQQRVKELERRQRVSELRRSGITDSAYYTWTFAQDDGKNQKASQIARNYVYHWETLRRDNTGLLIMGPVGSGKTFLACCIANALIDRGFRAIVTNMPKLIKAVGSFEERGIMEDLQGCDLLVIDDVGVERESAFALEQAYSIIDARYRSGRPLIVTTNLSPAELKSPKSLELQRIYDRIIEMCAYSVPVEESSRRRAISRSKYERANKLLEG